MKEINIRRIAEALISMPFGAVVVRIPGNIPFEVETTERSRNFRKAKVRDSRVEIPTGATVKLKIPGEEIEIIDWGGRPTHTPGASIKMGGKKADINSKNRQVISPNGVEINYKRE